MRASDLKTQVERKCYSPGEVGALAHFKTECDRWKLDLERYKLELERRDAEEKEWENSSAGLVAIFVSGLFLGYLVGGKK